MGFLGIGIAMVVIFILICALFGIGICGLAASIVLNCIFSKKWHEGKKYGKVVAIISRVGIGLSSAAMVPFIAMMIYAGVVSSIAPEDFIDGMEISYNKSEDYFYTSDSKYVVFEELNPYCGKDYTDDYFAYKPKGLFMKSSWCDLKLYETACGYTMFSYDEHAYVKEENLAAARAYYDEHYVWYHDSALLEGDDAITVESISRYHDQKASEDALTDFGDMEVYVCYKKYSDDELFYMNYVLLGSIGDSYYACHSEVCEGYVAHPGILLPKEYSSFAKEALYIPQDSEADV